MACAGAGQLYSYRMSKTELVSVTARVPAEDIAGIPRGGLSAFIRDAIAEKRARTRPTSRKPRSRLGKLLQEARDEYLASGGKPLSWAEVREEVVERGAVPAAPQSTPPPRPED
jgi:hypothetical protein